MHVRSAATQVTVQESSGQLRVVVTAEAREQASSELEEYRRSQPVNF
jgi:hypothetical protein